MDNKTRILTSTCLAALLCTGCEEKADDGMGAEGIGGDAGDTDGETGGAEDNDTDAGDDDGDGEPAETGEPECDGTSPYMGGWEIGCCQDEIVPTTWAPGSVGAGSVLPDWTFTDQFGEAVRVWDFCHNAIYFEYVALW